MKGKLFLPEFITSAFIAGLYIIGLKSVYIIKPWIDEVYTVDTAVNFLYNGNFHSDMWVYTYNPLYLFVQIVWLKIWGISHLSVCSLNILIAFVCFIILLLYLFERKVIQSHSSAFLFLFLYWGGLTFSEIFTNGRIDMMTMLFTVLLALELFVFGKFNKYKIFLFAFLLMLTSIYSIPIILYGYICLYVINIERRKELKIKGIIVLVAFALSYCTALLFHYFHGTLFRFVYSYFGFNSTLSGQASYSFGSRLVRAITMDIEAWVLFAITLIIYIFSDNCRKLYSKKYLLAVSGIPFFMVIAGRYVWYYSWIFYIPVLCLLILFVSKLERRIFTMVLLFLSILTIFVYHSYRIPLYNNLLTQYDEINNFIDENKTLISQYENVIVADHRYYYKLIGKYSCFDNIGNKQDQEQTIHETKRMNKMASRFQKCDWNLMQYPDEAIIITTSPGMEQKYIDMALEYKYKYKKLNASGDNSIFLFVRE